MLSSPPFQIKPFANPPLSTARHQASFDHGKVGPKPFFLTKKFIVFVLTCRPITSLFDRVRDAALQDEIFVRLLKVRLLNVWGVEYKIVESDIVESEIVRCKWC